MRHAILGVGGVGGLVGGALARTGADVLLLLRPETLARHPGRLRVESIVFGDFEVEVALAPALDREVDVVWVTPKATQLEEALELAPADKVGEAVVVPLLNGVDHVALLGKRYAHVLGAAIFVESERVEPGLVRQKTAFANVVLAPGPRHDEITAELRTAGFQVALASDAPTLLWEKLAFLAPLALTTTALGAPVGVVQADPDWNARLVGCHEETVSIGLADGATLDPAKLRSSSQDSPAANCAHRCRRTSTQGDLSSWTRSPGLSSTAGGGTGSRRRLQKSSCGLSRRAWLLVHPARQSRRADRS